MDPSTPDEATDLGTTGFASPLEASPYASPSTEVLQVRLQLDQTWLLMLIPLTLPIFSVLLKAYYLRIFEVHQDIVPGTIP